MEIQWPLVLFSLFAGTGGTLFAFSGLSELLGGARKPREVAAAVSLALMVIGGCFSVLHLASPLHALSAVTNLLSFSGISIELMLLGATFVVVAIYLVLCKRGSVVAGAVKAVAVIGLVLGLMLAFFCGHGYVIEGQPTWNTNLLPCAYLGTCLACGALAFGLVWAFSGEGELPDWMRTSVLAAAALSALSALGYAVFLGATAAAEPLLLWIGVAACAIVGTVAAAVAVWRGSASSVKAACAAGLTCAVVGGLSVRMLMWVCATGFVSLFAHTAPSVMMNL